jgi:hypothetical protein
MSISNTEKNKGIFRQCERLLKHSDQIADQEAIGQEIFLILKEVTIENARDKFLECYYKGLTSNSIVERRTSLYMAQTLHEHAPNSEYLYNLGKEIYCLKITLDRAIKENNKEIIIKTLKEIYKSGYLKSFPSKKDYYLLVGAAISIKETGEINSTVENYLYLENKDLENPRSNRDLLELLLNDIL